MASRFLRWRSVLAITTTPSRPLPIASQTPYHSLPILNNRVGSFNESNSSSNRRLSSRPSELDQLHGGPAVIDYGSLLSEDEYHRLADETIYNLQEKFEVYGDSIEIDGYDVDYGNQVLTLKLGNLGTYVINKQTPNRQVWLSSPVSGPSRFDWDPTTKAWFYRRTKTTLLQVLEEEIPKLCGQPIVLR